MPLYATPGEERERKLPPTGPQIARVVQVIDLGKQKTNFKNDDGTDKVTHKVMIAWELPQRKAVFKQEKGEEPFIVNQEYAMFVSAKANLRQDVEAWLGRKLTDKEAASFDVSTLLDTSGLLTVVHNESKGKTYANAGSLSPLMEGMVCPPRITPLIKYDTADGTNDTFKQLPEWIRKKIEAATDWKPF